MPKLSQYAGSLKVRLEYWEAGFRMMKDRYFVGGVGLRNFGDFYAEYKKPSYQEVKLAHSTAVQLLADMGVLGLASYAALWGFLLRGILKMKTGTATYFSVGKIGGCPRFVRRWIGLGGGLAAFALLVVARDISPFTKDLGVIDYGEWFLYMMLWMLSFLVIERLIRLDRPVVRLGLAAGCVGYLVHGMIDFDMFVPGVHQAALLAAACGCGLPIRKYTLDNTSKALVLTAALGVTAAMMLWSYGLLPLPDLLEGETLKEAGRRFITKGKVDDGIISLRKSAEANPIDDETHVMLSTTYWRMCQKGRKTFNGEDTRALALKSAHAAALTNPQSSAHQGLLARILAASDLEKAIGHAREAVRLYPARPEGHVLLANLLMKIGREEEARAEYGEALRLNELVMEPWLKIGEEDMERIRNRL